MIHFDTSCLYGGRQAKLICPPALLSFSKTITRCPRFAKMRAAVRPPIPAPTTTISFASFVGVHSNYNSRPAVGLITQVAGRRLVCSPTHPMPQAAQGAISS